MKAIRLIRVKEKSKIGFFILENIIGYDVGLSDKELITIETINETLQFSKSSYHLDIVDL